MWSRRAKQCIALITLAAALSIPGGCPAAGVQGGLGGLPQALVGVWRSQFNDPIWGPGTVELILMSNGGFQQQTAYAAGSLVTIFGTFRVFPDQSLLRLDIQRGEPRQTCGPLGCTDIIYPAGESHTYSIADVNTLVLTNINCIEGTGQVCTFVYGRAG